MLQYFKKSIHQDSLQRLQEPQPGCLTVAGPVAQEDVQTLAERLGLRVMDLVDVFDEQELPRMEHLGDSLIFYARKPLDDYRFAETTDLVVMIMSDQGLCILSNSKLEFVEQLFEKEADLATTQPARLLIRMLMYISHRFQKKTQQVHIEVEEIQKRLRRATSMDIEELIAYEVILNDYISALVPMLHMLQQILTGRFIALFAEDEDLFEDVVNSFRQSIDVCKVSVKNIVSLRDSFQILMTNRLNKAVQALTGVTIVLTIPTIISSVYGMNVSLPGAENGNVFWWLMGSALVVSGMIWLVFRSKRWM